MSKRSRPMGRDSGAAARGRNWLAERGIIQWRPREVSVEQVEQQISRGDSLLRETGSSRGFVGALRLIWSDPVVWPDSNERAGYVHGLVIDREFSGTSMGERLLVWAHRRSRAGERAVPAARLCRNQRAVAPLLLGRRFYRGRRRDFGDDADTGWFSVGVRALPDLSHSQQLSSWLPVPPGWRRDRWQDSNS